MTANEPVTNPALLEAIECLRKEESQETINCMLQEVMKAQFLAPVSMEVEEDANKEGNITLKKDTAVKFHTLNTPDQETYLMAFTDWKEIHQWRASNPQTIVMGFDDYATMIVQENSTLAGFVINPFGANVPFPKDIVMSLKKQREQQSASAHTMKAGERILIGAPEQMPIKLLEIVSAYLYTDERVDAVYLRLMKNGEDTSWLFMVDFKGDANVIFNDIAKVAKPYLEGMLLNMLPLDGLSEHTLDDVEPFYCKEGYVKPVIQLPSVAIIEDTFALKTGGCVLGCKLQQKTLCVNDEVEVIDSKGKVKFHCVIAGMECKMGKIEHMEATNQDGRVAIRIENQNTNAFTIGDRLRKKNM